MYIERHDRETFNMLSKELFNSASRWQKLLNNGIKELITRKVTETVPGENGEPDTTREVEQPVLLANGMKQFRQKYFTPSELMMFLIELKVKRDAYIAKMKAHQEEIQKKKAAQELEKKVQEELAGTALS